MKKRALLLFLGLLSIFAGAWMSYVVKDGCLYYLAAQASAGTIVLIGLLLMISAFQQGRKSSL